MVCTVYHFSFIYLGGGGAGGGLHPFGANHFHLFYINNDYDVPGTIQYN